jgi:hypothetical protein
MDWWVTAFGLPPCGGVSFVALSESEWIEDAAQLEEAV